MPRAIRNPPALESVPLRKPVQRSPDSRAWYPRHDLLVPEREEIARLHDEELRALSDIRRRESAMEAEEREMEREMRGFEEDADQIKRLITAEWRKERWGREPQRPPAWESR